MNGVKWKRLGRALGLAAAVVLAWAGRQRAGPGGAQGGDVVVFAAASLKNALDAVNAQWQKETGKKAVISYAASSALAKQIEQGAPAQMFISADLDWMDYLAEQEPDQAGHALQPARQPHRADRAQGQGAARSRSSPASTSPSSWATAACRWPTSTPCRPASTARRRWRSSACGPACRARSRRPRTCARRCCWSRAARRRPASSTRPTRRPIRNVKIVGTFPEDTHPPIIYPIALTASADASRRRGVPRLHQVGQGQAAVRGAGLHGAEPRAILRRADRERRDWR